MYRIAYLLTTQFENLGDQIINRILLHKLSRYGQVTVFVDPQREAEARSFIDVDASYAPLHEYRDNAGFDYVFTVPGEMSFRRITPISIIRRAVRQRLVRRKTKKICIGISFTPSTTFLKRIAIRQMLKDHFLVGARNQNTYMFLLRESRVPYVVAYCPDIFFGCQEILSDLAPTANNDPYIVLSFREPCEDCSVNDQYLVDIERRIHEITTSAIEQGVGVVLSYQVEFDRAFCRRLFAKLDDSYRNAHISIIDHRLEFTEAQQLYSRAAVVYTNRLHVFLFSLALQTSTYIVSDKNVHAKIYNLMNSTILEDMWIDLYKAGHRPVLPTSPAGVSQLFRDNNEAIDSLLSRIFGYKEKTISRNDRPLT
jgi:hypothetical protein